MLRAASMQPLHAACSDRWSTRVQYTKSDEQEPYLAFALNVKPG